MDSAQKSKNIGLLLAAQGELISPGIIEFTTRNNWNLINLSHFYGRPPNNIKLDGVITTYLSNNAQVRHLHSQNIPMVRIGIFEEPEGIFNATIVDDWEEKGAIAAEYFHDLKHLHVGYYTMKPLDNMIELFSSFKKQSDSRGMTTHSFHSDLQQIAKEKRINAIQTMPLIQEEFSKWLSTLPRPVGILCSTAAIADRQSRWAHLAGTRIPDEVSFLSAAYHPLTSQCAVVQLSSINIDFQDKLLVAFDTLRELIKHVPSEPRVIKLKPRTLFQRQSSRSQTQEEAYVHQALEFMSKNLYQDLAVPDIANNLGVSRRTLEKAFKNTLGIGINREFQRRRLHKACELLSQSKLNISEISSLMDFNSPTDFCRKFKQFHQKTPLEYRNSFS